MKTRKITAFLLVLVLSISLFAGCGSKSEPAAAEDVMVAYTDGVEIDFADFGAEMVPLAAAPAALSTTLMPEASGKTVYSKNSASIDASNVASGYVMCRYTGSSTKALKVMVTGPSGAAYYYNLAAGAYETFPLSDGSGTYKITVCQNTSGTKYAVLVSQSITVTLKDEFGPFLYPNQYVNFTADSAVVKKAAELTANCATELEKVTAVYDFVVKNFTYDKEKAQTVQTGYLPKVDEILAAKKGICFDYAAVMTAMLRSQGVPTKLVVGYAGDVYHAWISTFSAESGWVDGVIFFDGSVWKLMDPTFASTAGQSDAIMKYIGNGSNYTQKYLY